jgi:hypothetical protein
MNATVNVSAMKTVTKVATVINVKPSNKIKVDEAFLTNVYDAAINEGGLFQFTANLLASAAIRWDDKTQVSLIARQYRDGRMLGSLKAMLNKQGETKYPTIAANDIDAWNDLDKSDKERFAKGDYFRVYRAALSSFTLVCKAAGKPSAPKVTKAKGKTDQDAPASLGNEVIIPDHSIPLDSPLVKLATLTNEGDAAKLAMNVVRIIEAGLNGRKEGAKLGEWFPVLNDILTMLKAKAAK